MKKYQLFHLRMRRFSASSISDRGYAAVIKSYKTFFVKRIERDAETIGFLF